MKTTQYFDYTRKRPDRAHIKEDWIKTIIENPAKVEVQSDGRIRKWARITEAGKYLQVILIGDGETVHNAFFDRSFGSTRRRTSCASCRSPWRRW